MCATIIQSKVTLEYAVRTYAGRTILGKQLLENYTICAFGDKLPDHVDTVLECMQVSSEDNQIREDASVIVGR